jgi:exodeoxyribonuclease VII large subunit
LRSQYPFVRVIEAGASVQGEGAADEMAMAIDILNRLTNAEVILLVRGGGSPEELAAFNEERLARAIFASRVPVVTGIGHETDYTNADFVADVRAATPSLAAAVAVPDAGALVQRIGQLHRACTATMRHRLRLERNRWLEQNRALLRANPETRLKERRRRGKELAWTMRRAMESHLRSKRVRLDALTAQLQALDPLAVLNRGYSVLTDPANGRVVSRVDQVSAGSLLRARLSNGELLVRVEQP